MIIEVVPWNPGWPVLYEVEARRLMAMTPGFAGIEHIGSTAVPGLAAKPVIDIMAHVASLRDVEGLMPGLWGLDYAPADSGTRDRLHFRRSGRPGWHLHVVETSGWTSRKERLFRDALRADAAAAAAYGALKIGLAAQFRDDAEGYTRAKTAFIQQVMDGVRAKMGLPPEPVWDD